MLLNTSYFVLAVLFVSLRDLSMANACCPLKTLTSFVLFLLKRAAFPLACLFFSMAFKVWSL